MANAGLLTYVDPCDSVTISYDGAGFSSELDKKSFIGSRVSYNDVILHSFKVPESMSEDELKTTVEIKMYDDAGLDLQKKYKMIYTRKELDFEDSVLIEAFAVDMDVVTDSLASVLAQTKHIDFLALPFLSFATLYENKILEPKNDLFVYIDENEAFLSIYKDAKYLSTKSLMNLSEIVKKLETAGIDIGIVELKEHLRTKGLDATLYERDESRLYNELESIFSMMLTKINDIVVYNRSVFGLESIDRIFISTQNARLKGAREFIDNFGFNEVEVKDFNLFNSKEEGHFFEKIVASYIYDKLKEKDFTHNLTLFKREPAFYKKESGRVLIGLSLVLFVGFSFVGYVWFSNTILEKEKVKLQKQYDVIKRNETKYKSKIANTNKELKVVAEKKDSLNKKFKSIEKSMVDMEKMREQKSAYSDFIFDVNRLLYKYKLSITKIEMIGKDDMSIELIAQFKKRDNIAKFMEDLIISGFDGITTDEIKLSNSIYLSKIEIKR